MINGCGEGPAVRGSNPIWLLADLTGNLFDDTFYLWVLENDVPYIPATVWHDPAMTIPWTNPIRFLSNGTLPIDIYWDPSKFYRLEFRHNVGPLPPSQADPLIYLVENYSPNNAPEVPVGGDGITTDNQMANPQFAFMSSSEPYVLTAATNPASIEVAPGWFLDLAGTGNATIERVPLDTATPTPTNAPYALRLNLSGWTGNPVLRQRFQQNGQNWMGKNVAVSLTGRITGANQAFFVRLDASNGQPLGIPITNFFTPAFTEFSGFSTIPAFTNLDVPPDAYIDFKLFLPPTADIYVTSFQLIESDVAAPFQYEQTTIDRQIDHLFHYYKPKLEYKPIPSYLVAWDFPLNPAQILGDTVAASVFTGANQGQYAWDQTIIFHTVDQSVDVSRGTNGSLQLTCDNLSQVAIVQYLDQVQARKILSDRASVHLSLYGNVAAGAHGNVTLWATTDANLPTLPTTFITGLDVDGKPMGVTGAWTEVPNIYQNTQFDVPVVSATNSEANDISLNGWDLAGAAPVNTATFFAIVIGFSLWDIGDTINFNSVGLCAGDIATRPAPQTQAEVLLGCQRYFWKTFQTSTKPVTNVGVNTGYAEWQMTVPAGDNILSIFFPTTMRTVPTPTLYNPVVANNAIRNFTNAADCTASATLANITAKQLIVSGVRAASAVGSILGVHLTADARLGVVN